MAQKEINFTFILNNSNINNKSTYPIEFDVIEFTLHEELNQTFYLKVELVSHNPAVDFSLIIDQPITFTIWQDNTAVRHILGLVSDFYQGKTGFHRTRYTALVEPRLARTKLISNWRVFQQTAASDILANLLKNSQIEQHNIITSTEHLAREYCVQPGVTDFDFIQRLAAEEGFVYRFAMDKNQYQLIFTDTIQSFGDMVNPVIYNPNPGGDQPTPALREFIYAQKTRTTVQTQRDYTFKNPRYSQEHSAYSRTANTTNNIETQNPENGYERYDYPGRYKQDTAGIAFTQTRIQALRNDAVLATAIGDDARIEPGIAFELTGHPRSDLNTHWRAIRIIHTGKQHTAAEEEAANAQVSTSYEQTAELVPAAAAWKATIPEKHIIHGPLIAHVTGPEDEEIFTDEFGRVKVQFPWDRFGEQDEYSSCWIRVAQNWAGAGWGHMALPRIGQEVIVDFLDGDQDQPIITGRTYDANHPTPYKLPALKTQQTVKSKEHKGRGYSELLIDDTTAEIKTQLHTTHAATQLTLGFLTHPRANDGNGEHRGDGFELRTDSWGAIRAGKGMYISADTREKAQGEQLDLQEAIDQLKKALDLATELQRASETAQALPADVETQAVQFKEVFADLRSSGILINAPAGVAITTPKTVQISTEENIQFTALESMDTSIKKEYRVAAGDALSLLSVNKDLKAISNKGKVHIHAQHNEMDIIARKDLQLLSTNGVTTVAAKEELVLTCGGSYIKLTPSNIEIGCSGTVDVKAAGLNVTGPGTLSFSMPTFKKALIEQEEKPIRRFYLYSE